MILSDLSVKRPVFAAVLSLLLVAFGLLAFDRLPLREFPNIDPPVVSIETVYRGASADVVESRITRVIEDRIAGIEGIQFIESGSEDGISNISIEFNIERDIDAAANDIRDRVSGVLSLLPAEAEPPDIQKVNSNEDVVMWLNFSSDRLSVPALTDYAERYLIDRFSVLDGVARVRIGGAQAYAMRIWLNRNAMAARNITVTDVEDALRRENVELPAGSIDSKDRQFTIRVKRQFQTEDDFKKLVINKNEQYLTRLGDIARVVRAAEDTRLFFRGNGVPMVGIGIIKQSTANTLTVARAAKKEMHRLNPILPEGMIIQQSYDTSIFIEGAINEVYKTLGIAIVLVVLVIYLFLGSARATLIPAITVPISLIATSLVLLIFDYSINMLTLLALVLAIGLVVDDAIVVLENIHRRMTKYGESRLVAAFRGTRQVGFAVIATTIVLVAVFVPISFLQGNIGRLFSEFAITMAAAVAFSSFVALSLSPMLASKILTPHQHVNKVTGFVDRQFLRLQTRYHYLLQIALQRKQAIIIIFIVIACLAFLFIKIIPDEYTPKEDRGAFFVLVNGPEGATYDYMKTYMDEIEERLMPFIDSGEATRLLIRTPRGIGAVKAYNSGVAVVVLNDWGQRRPAEVIMQEIRNKLSDLPGIRAFPVMRQGFGARIQKPVQFVIGGGTYQELAEWRDILLAKINENNPGLHGIDWDYKETKPQMQVAIDYHRAADLGVTVSNIGHTLETMLGSRRVTTYIDEGQEYYILLEGERDAQRTPTDIQNIYVRSDRSGKLIPLSNLVKIEEFADSIKLNRYNRVRSITIEANLVENYSLGDALKHFEMLVKEYLPAHAGIDYKGQSRDYKFAGESLLFIFALGLLVVFLVLAAQFESWIHPFVIMLTVPLAMTGALFGLYISGQTL
ncbi:MAG: efflux RND transporter permease subunit, partial [Gammaproteobacteria bacterium]|nr:efflux RND transporter permease subunit [Gammaproteobacteria bacterium]